MSEHELKEPSKIDLIERIVKKSPVHENEIDGKCVYISLEHIDFLIKNYNSICKDYRHMREVWYSDKEKYRNALKDAAIKLSEKKYDEAEDVLYEAIGEW